MPGPKHKTLEFAERVRNLFTPGHPSPRLSAADQEPPLRAELLGVAQLENLARTLSHEHRLAEGDGPERLLDRLDENADVIHDAYVTVADAVRHGNKVAPAADWLLDNYYLIQEQVAIARQHLPPNYSRELPRLQGGRMAGFPRVYDLALHIVSHTDGRIDAENISLFLRAYQESQHLNLGELWAVPIMLRLALIENLRRVSYLVALRRYMQAMAEHWSERFNKAARQAPKSVVGELADFVRTDPPVNPAFVAELTSNLEGVHPSLGMVIQWIEQTLAEKGQTIETLRQAESQEQAANRTSISNTIGSLRALNGVDWRTFVEEQSTVEAILRRDPAGVYATTDPHTRNRCRREVEQTARRSGRTEEYVAETALALSDACLATSPDTRRRHVGFYLIGNGLAELRERCGERRFLRPFLARTLRRWALPLYLAAIAVATLLVLGILLPFALAAGSRGGPLLILLIAAALAASAPATGLVNWIASRVARPRTLPKLDFSSGIPADHVTAIVIPTLLPSKEEGVTLTQHLEHCYLANRSPNLLLGLLVDFPDDATETKPDDAEILNDAVARIRALNLRHAKGAPPIFFLLHRPRLWNPREGVWMAHERKRGKLEQFNHLILRGDTSPFATMEADLPRLRAVRHVVTLDSDTMLPPGSVARMVGAMAHPLNRPHLDAQSQTVTRGYAILQPRLGCALTAAAASPYARLLAGEVGLDPYTREVSNVYHDLFGRSPYLGKGIYDVAAFQASMEGRFPDNRILSHDLIESGYARCGFLNDVEVVEDIPATYVADAQRHQRWIRGDWQIARWLWPRPPGANGARLPNPLQPLVRWMILDNLRRSLVPFAWMALVLAGCILLPHDASWLWRLVAAMYLPCLARIVVQLPVTDRDTPYFVRLRGLLLGESRWALLQSLEAAFLPYQAAVNLDAIARAMFRLLVTGRRLLQWRTAASDRGSNSGLFAHLCVMKAAPLFGVLPVVAAVAADGPVPAVVVGLLWLAAPGLAWAISRPARIRAGETTTAQREFLGRLAWRTWLYFDTTHTPEHNGLPPDNIQETPTLRVAPRTSPTNMGMGLLSELGAFQMGYASAESMLRRIETTVSTLEKMERFHGHFFNWYDTRSLRPLHPRYISTVDSGNLAASLVLVSAGLRESRSWPLLSPRWRTAMIEGLDVVIEEAESRSRSSDATDETKSALLRLKERAARARADAQQAGDTASAACAALESAAAAISRDDDIPEPVHPVTEPLLRLFRTMAGYLARMTPWLEERSPDMNPTMEQIASDREDRSAGGKAASSHARSIIERAEELAQRCFELSEADFKFLYDRKRKLLRLGFNFDSHQMDASHYDLLASESRITSYLAIARGALPTEHWFCLGRPLAPGLGQPVLLSWSGSMFEYLMPMLFMPTYDHTLLHSTCVGIVERQIRYARARKVPWGISESGYNLVDSDMNYQYRAFGVPGTGLKRGLEEDLVVAPYATALSLLVRPPSACRNLEQLAGMGAMGPLGLYEAVDFTRSRVPRAEPFQIVRSHMAHHSGMTFMALVSMFAGNPMHRWFLSNPELRAALLLLQERVPTARPHARLPSAPPPRADLARTGSGISTFRLFDTPDTPTPEVHLLSNGRYLVAITQAGSGFSSCGDTAITRWQEDPSCDDNGTFFYIRDVDDDRVWSATFQPVAAPYEKYEAVFSQGTAEFRAVHNRIHTEMHVAVSPEADIETRRLIVSNRSSRTRTLEVTTYGEVVLMPARPHATHRAFHDMFVETDAIPERSALLFKRRPRTPGERWPFMFHALVVRDARRLVETSFETSRANFIGRNRGVRNPKAAARSGPLGDTVGNVLDPIFAIRHRISLPPGTSVRIDALTGVHETRDGLTSLIEKFHDARLCERVFDLAWTHSQVLLSQFRAGEADVQLYSRLASALLYYSPLYRAAPSLISRNRRGQSALWSHGVSGDLPIVLLRVGDWSNLDLARAAIQAHSYWRYKGLHVDLVIWSEAQSDYRQSMLDAIMGLLRAGADAKVIDQPGGIFVRDIHQIPDEDRILFQAVARIVLSDRAGTLEEQMNNRSAPLVEQRRLAPLRTPAEEPDQKPTPRDLAFNNGIGGFTADGREYVITLDRQHTPAPWINVLANPEFGSIVSESGGGYTWYRNAHEFRLTPWTNDTVGDRGGEAFYVRDAETGAFWSPMPWPARGTTPHVCRHGLGYTVFEHTEQSIFTEATCFVPVDAPVRITLFRVRNLTNRNRRIHLTAYCEWVLGELRSHNAPHVVTRLDPQSGAIMATNAFNHDFAGHTAFLDCTHNERSLTGDRTEFIGRNGSLENPAAMRAEGLSNRVGATLDPCAAILADLTVGPMQEVQVAFILGAEANEHAARECLQRFTTVTGARQALAGVWESWKRRLGGVYVETPDASVDLLVNHWLLYQVLTSRFWGRSGNYQSGGAWGFRDQLQDSLAMLHECPQITREHILRCASRQFVEGDVQHWWHPPQGRGTRTAISDDLLWLPYVLCRYVETTGDTGILDEVQPFIEGRPLSAGEESYFDLPSASEKRAPVYEHAALAIRHALRFGSRGLPLMGAGDWNDGMNRVGHDGRGESVWLAFFLCDVLHRFAALADSREDSAFASTCRETCAELRKNIEANAWDGDWYRRAFFDDGTPLGSRENPECRIDLLPQSWAAISGVGAPDRTDRALSKAVEHLVDREHRLIRLLTPPFDAAPWDPGYIKGYAPGVRENGGQYTHAAVWLVMAYASQRQSTIAWDLFDLINPIRHGADATASARYRVEPYVVAADVYAARGHEGRGGWTWYTGSAGWMYQLLVEHLLGVRLHVDTLSLEPLLPPSWGGFKVHYRFRETFYHINVRKTGPDTWSLRKVAVDGVDQADRKVHMQDDRKDHYVEIEAGGEVP